MIALRGARVRISMLPAAATRAPPKSSMANRSTVSARLASVPMESPIGALTGTRNLISFTTRRYRTEPLVITGPGAGAEVTAAGILNDIQYLAATAP